MFSVFDMFVVHSLMFDTCVWLLVIGNINKELVFFAFDGGGLPYKRMHQPNPSTVWTRKNVIAF